MFRRKARAARLYRRDATGYARGAMFTLAHISDPHLGPLPDVRWRELASKRLIGYANWQRKRGGVMIGETIRRVTADLREARPDHIAVTGDLINIGLPGEIAGARLWLDALGTPHDVTLVPGNHDAYVPGASARIHEAWAPYMSGDETPGIVRFPFVRRRGPVAIVGVSSAIATAPFMATGRIHEPQADALAGLLAGLGREGLFRVVMIHHPPLGRIRDWHRRLIGARLFRAAVASGGAELVLHGHNHVNSVAAIPGPAGPVPVAGVNSASQRPHGDEPGGGWLLFRIGREGNAFTCDMTVRAVAHGDTVETIGERRLSGPGA